MRYFIELSYLGTNYHGWQVQDNAITVQFVIQQALTKLLGHETPIMGSGRTDTGVHAQIQVAHFDCPDSIDVHDLRYKLNAILPKDIAIHQIYYVSKSAHARFDAIRRGYIYQIHLEKNPFREGLSWNLKMTPDLDLMNRCCLELKKHNNFQCFSKVKTAVESFECEIYKATWEQNGNEILFTIEANRFLRGMVRAIVGTMLDVGFQRKTVIDFGSIIKSRDRKQAGKNVPAVGLYLNKVDYPESILTI